MTVGEENKDYRESGINETSLIHSNNKTYALSRKTLGFLFVYYSVLIVAGIIIASYILAEVAGTRETYLIPRIVIISLSMSSMFSAIRYAKVLYTACIRGYICDKKDYNEYVGNLVYFLHRPIYAMALSILSTAAFMGGFVSITGNLDFFINERFVYLMAITSAIIGFSGGNILDKFNDISNAKIKKI